MAIPSVYTHPSMDTLFASYAEPAICDHLPFAGHVCAPSRGEDADIESEIALGDVIEQALRIRNQELREREVEDIAAMLDAEQDLPFEDEGLTIADIEALETLSAWDM